MCCRCCYLALELPSIHIPKLRFPSTALLAEDLKLEWAQKSLQVLQDLDKSSGESAAKKHVRTVLDGYLIGENKVSA